MNRAAAQWGVTLPDYHDLVASGAVIVICIAAWAVAVIAGRKLGPHFARLWERFAGSRSEGMAARMGDLTRYAVASATLAMVIRAERWPDLAEFILGLALAAAVALLVLNVIRALHLPRWVAAMLAAAAFVAILAEVINGLDPVMSLLDDVGFTLGKTRLSLLILLQIAIALLILLAVVRLLSRVINHSINRATTLDPTQQLLAQKLVAVALLIAAFFIGIDIIGIDLTAFAIFSGAFGLAIGFGLQKTFGNLIAGIILLMDRSIKPGDVIVVGQSFGHVTKIGVRAVSVVTRDGKEHLIPNELLMTQEVENWSYSSRDVRVHIPVGIAYGCDVALAQRLMVQAAEESGRVLKSPRPNVWLRAFGDKALEHEINIWIADPEAGVGNVQSEILNRLWILFQDNGIEVPYPQRDIRVKEWPPAS